MVRGGVPDSKNLQEFSVSRNFKIFITKRDEVHEKQQVQLWLGLSYTLRIQDLLIQNLQISRILLLPRCALTAIKKKQHLVAKSVVKYVIPAPRKSIQYQYTCFTLAKYHTVGFTQPCGSSVSSVSQEWPL